MNGPEAEKWVEAVNEELHAHEKNETWMIVPRKGDRKPIDSKWVFKILRDASGNVQWYKARLCSRISTKGRTRLCGNLLTSREIRLITYLFGNGS